jgi:transposase
MDEAEKRQILQRAAELLARNVEWRDPSIAREEWRVPPEPEPRVKPMEEQHSMMMRTIEIVERSSTAVGFEVLPKRWIVEHTFAWLSRFRGLARDFER